jgi:hypothetical protein
VCITGEAEEMIGDAVMAIFLSTPIADQNTSEFPSGEKDGLSIPPSALISVPEIGRDSRSCSRRKYSRRFAT